MQVLKNARRYSEMESSAARSAPGQVGETRTSLSKWSNPGSRVNRRRSWEASHSAFRKCANLERAGAQASVTVQDSKPDSLFLNGFAKYAQKVSSADFSDLIRSEASL